MNARSGGAADAAILLLVFVAAAWWGKHYLEASIAAGRGYGFYNELFEPALMTACGRGFHVAVRPPPSVTRFLSQADDRFSCESLPADLAMQPGLVPQGSWLYLMLMVAAAWRVLGFAWSAMAPLWGLVFGLASLSAYLIFRFGMGRLLALLCTAAFSLSSLQLLELPNLRDYAKAPFILGLFAILLSLALGAFSVRRLLALSALFGALVGLGYGIKPDTLIELPLFIVTIMLFLPVPFRAHAAAKGTAIAVGLLTCVLTLWPVFHATPATGNNLWHIAIIGLMPEYGTALGVENETYHMGVTGSDEFVQVAVGSYARRIHPDWPPMGLSTAEYERATRAYFAELASRFPADMMTRAVASIVRMPEIPFGWPQPPLPGLFDRFYNMRERVLAPLYGSGAFIVLASIGAVAIARPRQALFLLLTLAYVSAYPAIEFHNRNFFYLEVIGWLAIGFLVSELVRALERSRVLKAQVAVPSSRVVLRGALAGAAAVGVAFVVLLGLRAYQAQLLRRTMTRYLRAPVHALALDQADTEGTHTAAIPVFASESAQPHWARLLRVELSAHACHGGTLTYRYNSSSPYRGLTSTTALGHLATAADPDLAAPDRIVAFEPVYSGFSSLEVRGARGGCLQSVGQVTGLDDEPLWLPLVLDANWRISRLYQTIRTRENIH